MLHAADYRSGRRPPAPGSLFAAVAVAAGALLRLLGTREEATAASAPVAFASGIALWGFLELGFLTGIISGARNLGEEFLPPHLEYLKSCDSLP
jgi:hypothetical protein